jgi:anti-sigma factor RsiW
MLKHVTAEQIEQYRSKGMPSEDLLAFDRHLAQCGECRKQLANQERVTALLTGLIAASDAPEHLSYDQMTAYVDAKLGDVDREIESHVELCARCAAELGDLAAFAQMLSAANRARAATIPLEGSGRHFSTRQSKNQVRGRRRKESTLIAAATAGFPQPSATL